MTRALVLSLAFYAATDLLYVFYYWNLVPVVRAGMGAKADPEEHLGMLQMGEAMLLARSLLVVVGGLTFLWWTYRVLSNARITARGATRHSPGWAAGFHFVPVLRYWRPYQALKEGFEVHAERTGDWRGSILLVWWGFLVLSIFLNKVMIFVRMRWVDDFEMLVVVAQGQVLVAALSLVTCLVFILMVVRVTTVHEASIHWKGKQNLAKSGPGMQPA